MFSRVLSIGLSLFLIFALAAATFGAWWFVGLTRGMKLPLLVFTTVAVSISAAWLVKDIITDVKQISL